MMMKRTENFNNLLVKVSQVGGNSVSLHRKADIIMLEIIDQDGSHASHILKKLLNKDQIATIRESVAGSLAENCQKTIESQVDIAQLVDKGIQRDNADTLLNTGHFLLWLLGQEQSGAASTLKAYGVSEQAVREYVGLLPDDENYYEEVGELEKFCIAR